KTNLPNHYVAADVNEWTADDEPSVIIVIVVVAAPAVHVGVAAVFLRLSRRQSTVAPSRLSALAPSRRIAVTAAEYPRFVSVVLFPALVVIVTLLVVPGDVLVPVPVVLVLSLPLGHRGEGDGDSQGQCCDPMLLHAFLQMRFCGARAPRKRGYFSSGFPAITKVSGMMSVNIRLIDRFGVSPRLRQIERYLGEHVPLLRESTA